MTKSKLQNTLVNVLESKAAYGESRYAAKLDGSDRDKIFSYNTMAKYKQIARDFSKFVDAREPGLRRKKDAIKHIDPYLRSLQDAGASAWTQQTTRSGLTKIFGQDHSTIVLDQKERRNIIRSRLDTEYARHFSVSKNTDLINFCQNTGLRRSELEKLRPDQLHFRSDGQAYLTIKGKGGKVREAIILNNDPATLAKIQNTPTGELVWGRVHGAANIHGYRGEYATKLYNQLARPIKELKQRDIYSCRKDLAGARYDKAAMRIVSNNLGHNRIDVIAANYLYSLSWNE